MKKADYKKITRYSGWAKADLWEFGPKTRKKIKTNDSRRYRRHNRRICNLQVLFFLHNYISQLQSFFVVQS